MVKGLAGLRALALEALKMSGLASCRDASMTVLTASYSLVNECMYSLSKGKHILWVSAYPFQAEGYALKRNVLS